MNTDLDNPIFAALRSRHRTLALGAGEALRYPAAIAPFVGLPDDVDALPDALVAPGETVYLLGETRALHGAWSVRTFPALAQMVCDAPVEVPDGDPISLLGEADRGAVLALTALVYPHYFRPHTMQLGRYFGIHLDGRLAAIIGERMATDACQEISAVCTHPDFLGRGLARRLLAWLGNDILAQGRTPFLHVSHENLRAKQIYERGGYRLRRDLGFWSVQRA